ncbi:FAD-binding and (Fe-S)-binding domain-containing protein [Reinekea blandensis]|uniref:D-lactate dehydrogenase (cytochrome) n=1 Tax=Reinekea blandensis MED297 TaxID=314283 RepID=A4BC69_9GAMM|nr:FAD-binding and (Fe-S)-binding domain-containing protein [Reinekea blandensis]EAR10135.1 oxidoreductase, FAD-binding protein [Reinekea sp. MED297] [Reinekea blandensis MED297]
MPITHFLNELRNHLPEERIITDEFRRFTYSTDASFYRMLPQAIVRANSEQDIVVVLQLAGRHQVPITFRAAGTSLSGQAVTDSVLVLLTDEWQGVSVDPLGETVHVQPGVIGGRVNQALLPYGRKIGPDPASINACKIGGIVANNASGMCCGTKHNSYHTLQAMRLILPDGTVLDTRDEASVTNFRASHEALLSGLTELRESLLSRPELCEKVRHKYRLKNTTGYGMNALLDFEDPIDILTHLVVGSEGTLGFISEVSLQTVDELPQRASAMVGFSDLNDCALAVARLRAAPVDAVELLDMRAIQSVSHLPGLPAFARQLPDAGGLLLIDVRATNPDTLAASLAEVDRVLGESPVADSTGFTTDSSLIEEYWHLRKGTFPAVGANRPAGTTVIIEDVAFPIERLAEGVERLQALFDEFGYREAIIFGHALEGNLHFVFTQSFDEPAEVQRYDEFMASVSDLVALEFGGSLKAEHGTGRNMAPFVKLEWGESIYELMTRIKRLIDPNGLLNPGVILNDDEKAHLKHLKPMPVADPVIDRCIECGFCEDVCPSQNYSLTPRQRIAAFREIQRRKDQQVNVGPDWDQAFQTMGIDTCAATGLCELKCPVGINTGELVLKLRSRQNYRYRRLSALMARHFAAVASWVRFGLMLSAGVQRLFGANRLEQASLRIRQWSGQRTPVWLSSTPRRSNPIYARNERIDPNARDTVVYWSSCASQSMGPALNEDRRPIPDAVRSVLEKARLNVVYPQPTRGLCCGQPFRSKGQNQEADLMMNEVLDALWEVSSAGRYPVLADASPCSLQVREEAEKRGIHLYDSSAFIDRFLLSRLEFEPEPLPVAVHVTCSTQKQGLERSLLRVLDKVAPNWTRPEGIYCCGFAGDKGFTQPELNASALKSLAGQVKDCRYGISTSRTCEIGLSRHSGLTYYSLFEVVDRCSKAANTLEG